MVLGSKIELVMLAPGRGCLYGAHYSAICMQCKKNYNGNECLETILFNYFLFKKQKDTKNTIQGRARDTLRCKRNCKRPSTLDIEYRSVYPNVPFGAVCCG